MRTPTTAVRIAAVAAVGAVAALGAIVPMGVASAAEYPAGGTPPDVSPAKIPTAVAGKTVARKIPTAVAGKTVARTTLPFTGTDVVEITAIAGISAGVGLVMVRRSRRASTA